MSSNRHQVQVTVQGNGFTADIYTTRTIDATTFVKAIKGKAGADKWLANETAFAAKNELAERPFADNRLALISAADGTEKCAPVWVVGWTTEKEA